ncbi:hypothetical protein [Streptomyces lateritius]|uniref:hypothetical protein n=1 Tax=Streptomyces lateritius TaxID=67313 RepID=UPI001C8CDE89|nr:hypothetical protein [Streptomyces lateritius]MBX9420985.1 hypothetical protein [Streptomyces lateritius]
MSDYAFNNLGTIPADGALVQGTGGGASTPVAMFVAGSRINFASPEEVVETGYGANWREKVRAIPSRVFNEFHADIPPDGSLIQGIANGVPTAVEFARRRDHRWRAGQLRLAAGGHRLRLRYRLGAEGPCAPRPGVQLDPRPDRRRHAAEEGRVVV